VFLLRFVIILNKSKLSSLGCEKHSRRSPRINDANRLKTGGVDALRKEPGGTLSTDQIRDRQTEVNQSHIAPKSVIGPFYESHDQ
jgi:hypothetical protein